MKEEEAKIKAEILKALANPVRLKIVEELSRVEKCACEMLNIAKVDFSVLSRHMAQLKNVGIVTERRKGVRIYYRLACPCILQALECTVGVMRVRARKIKKAI